MSFKVWVHALGCRSNLCDGDFLVGDLTERGSDVCGGSLGDFESGEIDAAVIVTCSVTAEADRKCRQLVRRARKILGEGGIVAVCGCWAQGLAIDAAQELGIDVLAGTRGRAQIAPVILGMLENHERVFHDLRYSSADTWEELPLKNTGLHTRAFVKVQEGCAHFCTYCIIPYLRGRPVSRPVENVRNEIKKLIDNGCREVILTGTHLGAWGRDFKNNADLAILIRAVSDIHGLTRLRMGSLEPFALNENLIAALADSPVFMPHLHLPLQSGDDGVLARMRRGYTAREFIHVCDTARARLGENLHVSSDILVGFPGESDAAFENTLSVMRSAGLARVHVFPFSSRAGTVAASFTDAINPDVKSERTERAIALGSELLDKYASRFINHVVTVLSESGAAGYTEHYLEAAWPVRDLDCDCRENELVQVCVRAVRDGRLECELI